MMPKDKFDDKYLQYTQSPIKQPQTPMPRILPWLLALLQHRIVLSGESVSRCAAAQKPAVTLPVSLRPLLG